jgi:cytoskeleton protein RodZ
MSEMNESSNKQHDALSPSREMAGVMLQRERERQGLGIEDVALQLNLRPIVVTGIEEDRFDQVPIAAYRRGYVRAYARLLGMDESRVVGAYDATHGRGDMERKLSPVHTSRPPSRVGAWIFRLFTLLVIVGLIALTLLWWQSREGNEIFGGGSDDSPIAVDRLNGNDANADAAGSDSTVMTPNTDTQLPPTPTRQDTPSSGSDSSSSLNDATLTGTGSDTEAGTGVSASAETTTPDADARQAEQVGSAADDVISAPSEDAAATDTATPAATNDDTLSLTFNEESWTEIYDANDDRIFSGLQSAGSQASAEGEPPFRLTIGNASGVTLEYRGESVDLSQYTGGNNVARFTLGD